MTEEEKIEEIRLFFKKLYLLHGTELPMNCFSYIENDVPRVGDCPELFISDVAKTKYVGCFDFLEKNGFVVSQNLLNNTITELGLKWIYGDYILEIV